MSVLKPINDNGTVQMTVKVPVELRDRATKVKEALKAKGFTIDITEAAVAGIKRLVKSAEKELKGMAIKGTSATPAPPLKLPAKPATKAVQKTA